MAKKQITIQQLAEMIKRGFDDIGGRMATKQDVAGMVTKQEFRDFQRLILEEFDLLRADVHDIKIILGPLVKIVATQDAEIKNLHVRVARLERKVGMTK